ncbi:MAG TPA: hypothetical protein GX743_04350 [Actinomycetales bacterium]|nr:hypothetical protein [Actinomycetales bacterium]
MAGTDAAPRAEVAAPRLLARERLAKQAGTVSAECVEEIRLWVRSLLESELD